MDYILIDLKLTAEENDFSAIPAKIIYKSRQEIVHEVVSQEGTILKETETNAAVNAFFKKILLNLTDGFGYRDGIFTLTPTIQGVFLGEDDRFDPERHTIVASLAAGDQLKQAASQIELRKTDARDLSPKIKEIRDLISNEVNSSIAPRSIVELYGDHLKFNPEASDQGVFLVNTATADRIKITEFREIYPKKITLVTPADLPVGTYDFEIHAAARKSQTVRIGKSSITISVN
ncbi:MAG: DUF4469 domain-containing protein [Marinilabiliaceae bacterium]|nr:DUF4469 domain-containing protein [Marinilabiliaceae bacterium]